MTSMFNDISGRIEQIAREEEPRLVAIRRDIHAHPETAFEEIRTSAIVSAELTRLGITHRTGIGRTGVVADIAGGRPGPTLLIRADMDALPIEEQTGLPFASTYKGRMHACGHDLHTSTLIGVGAVLKAIAPQLAGNVRLMFQPAEETAESGAAAMIAEGVLENVDMALGFHNYPDEATGTFSFVPGIANGSSDDFDIVIRGLSGHAAHPNQTVDPIVAAAHLVLQLQTIVSREVDPMHPAVLTIGAIRAGDAHNIIPDSCTLRGTVRTQHPEARDQMEAALRRQCQGLAAAFRVACDIHYDRGVPSLVSDQRILDATMTAIRRHFGDVVVEGKASLGAEDFALVGERVPAFQLGIGASQPGRNDRLHNSDYQPDERSIGLGVVALSLAAVELLT